MNSVLFFVRRFVVVFLVTGGTLLSVSSVVAQEEPTKGQDISHGTTLVPNIQKNYSDGRPDAKFRLGAIDAGRLLRHGDGPDDCDINGMREASVIEHDGTYYLYYDGCAAKGWIFCLATSRDLVNWAHHGPKLTLGTPEEDDSGAACAPWFIQENDTWHMFYFSCRQASASPDLIPMTPYTLSKARGTSPEGPWEKQKDVVPFRPQPGTYNADTACPGFIVKHEKEYLMFYSAATWRGPSFLRTLAIARTGDLNGAWQVDPEPIVPLEEQIENSSLYFEPTNQTWFLFTNHIGIDEQGVEYTDAIWVYWSKNIEHWNTDNKAVVLDGYNCIWSKKCIGMPSVIQHGDRLALFYDAPGGESDSHMKRDLGLAWLQLPLVVPKPQP